jgi:monovalent cation/hydrogen antiporter
MPWSAALTLGALVAPPDAVAALAVLRQVKPPYRMRMVLEGESLLNDISALLIYNLAIDALAAGSITMGDAAPGIPGMSAGSIVLGFILAWPIGLFMARVSDAGTSVILQFVTAFGVWLVAEALHLSSVITTVVFALTLSQRKAFRLPARLRIPSFTVWETTTTILNVLAFTLVGLQLGPILGALGAERLWPSVGAAAGILSTVIAVWMIWVVTYHGLATLFSRCTPGSENPDSTASLEDAVTIGWADMRGIVTLAAAMALPADFPCRAKVTVDGVDRFKPVTTCEAKFPDPGQCLGASGKDLRQAEARHPPSTPASWPWFRR